MKFEGQIITRAYFADCFQSRLTYALNTQYESARLFRISNPAHNLRANTLQMFDTAPYFSYLAYPEVRAVMNKCLYKIRPTESTYIDKRMTVQAIKKLPANDIVLAFAIKDHLGRLYPGLGNIYRIIQEVIEEKDNGIQPE